MKFCLAIILFFLCSALQAQNSWTDINNLSDSIRTERKPTIILLSSEWCKYCQLQKQLLSEDTTVAEMYLVTFDVESEDSIVFLGRTFTKSSNEKYHGFATFLSGDKITLPTVISIDKNLTTFKKYYKD